MSGGGGARQMDLFGAAGEGGRAGRALTVYVDGASRNNPGEAAIAVVIWDGGAEPALELGERIGRATNNEAEYLALIRGLREALAMGARRVRVRSDSEFLVRQVRGEYRVKKEELKPLHAEAAALVRRFERVILEHIPRGRNRRADALCNRALDEAAGAGDAADNAAGGAADGKEGDGP